MTAVFDRPETTEYAPFYGTYVAKVPAGDLCDLLERQIAEIEATFRSLPAERGRYAYAPGKWTINEVVGHMSDTERVFSYRLVSFARLDPASLPSFDENAWAPAGGFNDRTLSSLIDELIAVRRATVALLRGLPNGASTRRGTASGREISVRAIAHIIYGHVAHHLGVIKERYLS